MSKTFLISDTHFNHSNILTFKRGNGDHLRVFDNVQHMDDTMVNNWNRVVKPNDKVYHLGDIFMGKNYLFHQIMQRLNGTKVLIKGNHDQLKLSVYQQYFKDVRAYHQLDGFLLSHIPIHPTSLSRWKGNIHGHLHSDVVLLSNSGERTPDPYYINVAVEQINYTPIDFEELRSKYG